jgi:hypothetical protein
MSKTKLSFPKPVASIFHGANNEATAIVKSVLGKVASGGSIKVVMRPGTKKNKNGWSWYDPANKMQVMMLTHGGPKDHTIEVAHDPKNIAGFLPSALVHEMVHCHHERTIGKVESRHDPRYKGKVWGWN